MPTFAVNILPMFPKDTNDSKVFAETEYLNFLKSIL